MKLLEVLMRENPDVLYLPDKTELHYNNIDAVPFYIITKETVTASGIIEETIPLIGRNKNTHGDLQRAYCESENIKWEKWSEWEKINGRFWYDNKAISFYQKVPARFLEEKINLLNNATYNLSGKKQPNINNGWWINVYDAFDHFKDIVVRIDKYLKDNNARYETSEY